MSRTNFIFRTHIRRLSVTVRHDDAAWIYDASGDDFHHLYALESQLILDRFVRHIDEQHDALAIQYGLPVHDAEGMVTLGAGNAICKLVVKGFSSST